MYVHRKKAALLWIENREGVYNLPLLEIKGWCEDAPSYTRVERALLELYNMSD